MLLTIFFLLNTYLFGLECRNTLDTNRPTRVPYPTAPPSGNKRSIEQEPTSRPTRVPYPTESPVAVLRSVQYDDSGFSPYDRVIVTYLNKNDIPGAIMASYKGQMTNFMKLFSNISKARSDINDIRTRLDNLEMNVTDLYNLIGNYAIINGSINSINNTLSSLIGNLASINARIDSLNSSTNIQITDLKTKDELMWEQIYFFQNYSGGTMYINTAVWTYFPLNSRLKLPILLDDIIKVEMAVVGDGGNSFSNYVLTEFEDVTSVYSTDSDFNGCSSYATQLTRGGLHSYSLSYTIKSRYNGVANMTLRSITISASGYPTTLTSLNVYKLRRPYPLGFTFDAC